MTTSQAATEISGYFPGARETLYGTYRPADGRARAGAVLLAPYGEERKCTLRLFVELARRLGPEGIATLRFDYAGTGESGGVLAAQSLAGWQGDAVAAVTHLKALAGAVPIIALGARLGANLAIRLPVGLVAGAVLWEPLPTGAELLAELIRRKQVKEMMGGGQASSGTDDIEARWAAGEAVDVDGFALGAAFAEGLRRLDLGADLTARTALPVCLLHLSGAHRLSGKWPALAELCEGQVHRRFQTLREKPFWGRTEYEEPKELLRETIDFCGHLGKGG